MKKEVNNTEILEGLKPTSTVEERLHALRKSGIPSTLIAKVLGVSESSIRNWYSGYAKPKTEAYERLDDIRTTMQMLTEGGNLPPERATQWLNSREEEPPFDRPIDIIATNPDKVFELAKRCIAAFQNSSESQA